MRALLILVAALALATPSAAEVPSTLSYQGVLRDHGTPVPDDDYAMTFTIYDSEIGGTALWTESRIVDVADGVFSVTLGDVTPLSLDFEAPYWLEISVGGEAPMSPRTELTSAPYAFRAGVAESLAGGVPADGDWSMNGDVAYRVHDVGIGTATPMSKLTIASDDWDDHLTLSRLGNSPGHISIGTNQMILWSGSGSGLYIGDDGNVGVGVSMPASKFQVDGTAHVTGFQLPTGASEGYVLTSDASGVGTWQSPSGDIGGSGTVDYVPRFTDASTLGDSPIRLSGTMVGIGTTPSATLHVNGTMDVEDTATFYGDLYSTNVQSDSSLTLASGSVNRLHLDASGNVGVGTASPNATLDVAGTAEVDGFRMPTGAADGRVLVCDASGNASWEEGAGLALPYSGSSATSGGYAFEIESTGEYSTAGRFEGESCGVSASSNSASVAPGFYSTAVSGYSQLGGNTEDYKVSGVAGYGGTYEGVSYGVRGKADGGDYEGTTSYGVHAVSGWAEYGFGLYAETHNNADVSYAIYGDAGTGTEYAGYFSGDVHVNGTLSKSAGSFRIDHPLDPEDMYLSHSFVESPDMMNVYNGNVVLDARGEALVELPDYFEALNRDYRYQLTPIGGAAPNLHIAERISGGRFLIAGGEPGLEVSWQVTGVRQDRFAQEHRIEVETMKRAADRGKYLNPELYGRAESEGIHHVESALPDTRGGLDAVAQ